MNKGYNPSKKLSPEATLVLNFRRINNIVRCNNFPKIRNEDVGQHTTHVTLLAMVIADEINAIACTSGQVPQVDVLEVMRKAILHDMDEAFTSDIPWNIKHSSKELNKSIQSAINQKMEKRYKECSAEFSNYFRLAKDCKEGLTGLIVDLADMLELALYTAEEVHMGNAYMYSLLQRAYGLIGNLVYDWMYGIPTFNSLYGYLGETLESSENALLAIDLD